MEATHSAVSRVGAALVIFAVLTFVAGAVIFITGIEVAFIPMLFSLGVFTTGIGVLSVGRDRR